MTKSVRGVDVKHVHMISRDKRPRHFTCPCDRCHTLLRQVQGIMYEDKKDSKLS